MKTLTVVVDKGVNNLKRNPQFQQAAQLLQQNEVVAFPTETVYGLGANAMSDEAVAKIFAAKGRPSDNPLIVHIAKLEQLEQLVTDIPQQAKQLMEAFWPGALTIILPKKDGVSQLVTAGLSTVAVRMPDHEVALALIEAADRPLAAPSANTSGKPSPTDAEHVIGDLAGKIAAVVDGGAAGIGVESTVIDCTVWPAMILRPGGITKEEIEAVIGEIGIDPALVAATEKPKSPGMKYKHYAPEAPLYVIEDEAELRSAVVAAVANGQRVGLLAVSDEYAEDATVIFHLGKRSDLATITANLYRGLRVMDEQRVDCIFVSSFAEVGIGVALMNRLLKAADKK